ncbi:MAG: hypothetical protein PWP59_393 [Sphaerochaeta sp.]|nr:hypothetical protein [Sphaerochaeta sp.]
MNVIRLKLLVILLSLSSILFASDSSFLSTLSDAEIALLAQQEPLTVLVDPAWEPLEYLDKQGNPTGLSYAYLQCISSLSGLTFIPVEEASWQDAYDKLLSGEIAMTGSISKTEEREATLRFSEPYLTVPLAIIAGEQVGYIGSLAELEGKRVAVVSHYAAQEWLARDYPNLTLVEVPSVSEGLLKVSRGECFALVENLLVANHYRAKLGLSRKVKVVGTTAYMNSLSIAVHEDYASILPIINKALQTIDSETRERLYRTYLPLQYERTVQRSTIYLIVGLALIVAVILGFWIWKLIEEVQRRKAVEKELADSEIKFKQLFSNAPVPMVLLTHEGKVASVNDAWVTTFGFKHGEINDIDIWYEKVYPDPTYRIQARQSWEAAVEESRRNKLHHIESHEYTLVAASGTVLEMEISGAFLDRFLLITFFDITERNSSMRSLQGLQEQTEQGRRIILNALEDQKIAQQSLAQSKATLDAAINSMIDSVFIIDPESRFILVNKAFLRYYRFSERTECPETLNAFSSLFEAYDSQGNLLDKQKWAGFQALSGKTGDTEYTVVKRETGERWIGSYSYAPIRDEQDVLLGAVVVCRDVTEIRANQKKLIYQRNHDYLTGLYSRAYFEHKLQRLEHAGAFTLALIDINGLKLINDSFGHDVGDSMLKATAQILRKCSTEGTTIARYGGDEFVFLLPGDSVQETEALLACVEERSREIRIESFRLSISSGYAVKEVGKERLQETLKRAEDHLQRNKIYESASAKNKSIGLVINSLFAKSPRELQHSRRVSLLSVFLAKQLHLSESDIKRIQIAALLHDIGKIGINESILNKPTRLEDNERDAVKRHPEIGYRILSASVEYSDLSLSVLEHHERWDGTGYPRGLKREAISLPARIISVADSYDAMTSERSYKKPLPPEVAIAEIKRCSGSMYDPAVVSAFLSSISQFRGQDGETQEESELF